MIIIHPTLIILIGVVFMIFIRKNHKLFALTGYIFPLVAFYSLWAMPELISVKLFKFEMFFEFTYYNKLIATAFVLCLSAANIYAVGKGAVYEMLFGSAYAAFSISCISAADFISMFISLELMMIMSAAIIFIGSRRESFRAAQRYFLTHLISSNLIFIGLVHIIYTGQSPMIVNVVDLLSREEYSPLMIYSMLAGILINIAAVPFSGWMVNYYSKASPSGFLYLISFTTKASVFILVKLFSGLFILNYVGILMIAYGGYKAMYENNLFGFLCLLSIAAMGTMLIGISEGSAHALDTVLIYLFIHLIYKMLLSIYCAIMVDYKICGNVDELKFTDNKLLNISIIAAIITMINLPITSSFYIKSLMSGFSVNGVTYAALLFFSFIIPASIPWRNIFATKESVNIKLDRSSAYTLILMCSALCIILVSGYKLLAQDAIYSAKSLFTDSLKQVALIAAGIIVGYKVKHTGSYSKPLNAIEFLGEIFFSLYRRWDLKDKNNGQEDREYYGFDRFYYNIYRKISALHNQQTSIILVIIVFLVMLGSFIVK